MPLPTQEFLNDWLEDEMPIEIRKRETIKEFRRYKKLSIKTKLRKKVRCRLILFIQKI